MVALLIANLQAMVVPFESDCMNSRYNFVKKIDLHAGFFSILDSKLPPHNSADSPYVLLLTASMAAIACAMRARDASLSTTEGSVLASSVSLDRQNFHRSRLRG